MLEENLNFKNGVMRRVYIVYWWRRVTDPLVLKLSGLLLVLGLELTLISVRSILANASQVHGVAALGQYLFKSFTRTELPVQAMAVLGIVLILVLGRDLFKKLTTYVYPSPFNA